MADQTFIQGPKMDWTEDPELHKRFKEWKEETELLVDTALSHIKDKTIKVKYVTLWAGKEARTYLTTVSPEEKYSLETILDTLEEWTKPNADEITAFTQLRALNQGNKILSMYIQEVRRLVDLCNLDCEADKDKLIRNSIIAGINSTKAYQHCILKGSSLSLADFFKICQRRMLHADKFKPYIQSLQTAVIVHQFTKSSSSLSTSEAGAATGVGEPTEAVSTPGATGPSPGKTTGAVCVITVEDLHTTPDESVKHQEWNATHVTRLDILHTCVGKAQRMTRLWSST